MLNSFCEVTLMERIILPVTPVSFFNDVEKISGESASRTEPVSKLGTGSSV